MAKILPFGNTGAHKCSRENTQLSSGFRGISSTTICCIVSYKTHKRPIVPSRRTDVPLKRNCRSVIPILALQSLELLISFCDLFNEEIQKTADSVICSFCLFELACVQPVIVFMCFHQRFMGSLFYNIAMFENKNQVRILNCRKSMCNDNYRDSKTES